MRTVIRRGKWNCSSCGATNIQGQNKICPQCGASRDPSEAILHDDNAPEVTDKDQLQEALSGPEWNCEHCGTANSTQEAFCTTCSAPVGSSPKRKTEQSAISEPLPSATLRPEPSPLKARSKPYLLAGLVAAAIAIVAFGVYFFVFQTKEHPTTVKSFSWSISTPVEQLNTYQREGWNIPAGGRLLRSETRPHGSVTYQNGTETKYHDVPYQVPAGEYVCNSVDLGNGYFRDTMCPLFETRTRTEAYQAPVYATRVIYDQYYWYEIDIWEPFNSVTTTGQDQSPYLPEVTLLANQRSGEPDKEYWIIFVEENGNEYRYSTNDLAYWQEFHLGQAVTLEINRLEDVVNIKS